MTSFSSDILFTIVGSLVTFTILSIFSFKKEKVSRKSFSVIVTQIILSLYFLSLSFYILAPYIGVKTGVSDGVPLANMIHLSTNLLLFRLISNKCIQG